ncbi:hypothetical protein RhiirA1_462746 [Rhizophagus irregularis]|uniref:F-box domain-containing protein n=1 Tax=Rhizophagus irregularis TaxID=588596 RepID=A0A2N0RLJ5_9GLOM|nr:hypothetical protein RhiirA1_462746 [Rhizophagus irregularis]
MSDSNTFLGDLPELSYEIINYLKNDFSTLYSCILVNKLWCRLAIPLLWENPFSNPTRNYSFIEIYLNNLNDDFKTKLNEYEIINISLFSKNIMFNYLKEIYFQWLADVASINTKSLYNSEQDFKDFRRLVLMSLFKIFIENEVNLDTLEIKTSSTNYNSDILELILKNQNFIHNVKNLKLHIDDNNDCKIIYNRITQIIHLHQNLKKILIVGANNYTSLYLSLLLSKDYNCSNTLNTIIFYCVIFKSINNLDKVLEQLNVLESVHIFNCSFLDSNFTQQIINLTKPFKLKSLFHIYETPQIETVQQLLQKSGDYLENFGFIYNASLNQQLLKYCKNIKFFYFLINESSFTYQLINLIENIKQSLSCLSIILRNNPSANYSSFILQNLGQILSSKLDYLSLDLNIKKNDFRVFLENSQYILINKLIIAQSGSDDILHYIKEHIMKEKRVKYLAIKNFRTSKELLI